MAVQSARFSLRESPASVNSGRGWTEPAARDWLRAHDFIAPKADRTANQLRFRQFPPGECREDSFSTLTSDLPVGVQLVDCTRES